MKKLLYLIITVFCLAFAMPSALAEEENLISEVNVIVNIHPSYRFTAADTATFTLCDGETTYERTVPVSANREALGMTFDVTPYAPGKTFTLTATSGVSQLLYYDKLYSIGEPLTLYTYSSLNPDMSVSISNTTYMSYIPVEGREIFPYYNGNKMVLPAPAVIVDNSVMFPIRATAEYMQLPSHFYDSAYNSYTLRKGSTELIFNMNNAYTSLNGNGFNSPTAPTYINGLEYAPISVIADVFGVNLRVVQNDKGYQVFLIYSPQTEAEQYVNSAGLSSETEYLIWVSKQNFTVHIFTGYTGNWQEIKAYPCSIGAKSTPTCEGTYKYYEPIQKWDYGTYYVGPVMRFNKGYALHSVILNNDGSFRDGRVGKMISHGCVRLLPDDMNWMFSNIPLKTTVHVTA